MISFRAKAIRIARAVTLGVLGLAAIAVSTSVTEPGVASAQQLDKPIELREEANKTGADSQKRVEEIATETDGLIAEYRLTNKKIESLQIFNQQLSQVVTSQNEELASLQKQIDGVEEIGRAVTPLMLKMIDSLDKFVQLDVPFLPEERKSRIDKLRVLMRRADVADAERYRSILEAYQIESDYGRTIDATAGSIMKNGVEVPVDFLRVGRIALMYQTRDGAEIGAWNKKIRAWEPVEGYENWMSEGLRVAKKQAAPQLIRVPLPQPEQGGSN
jgi:TolA-binding protein